MLLTFWDIFGTFSQKGRKLFQCYFLNDNRCCSYTAYSVNDLPFRSQVGPCTHQSAFSIGNYNLGPN